MSDDKPLRFLARAMLDPEVAARMRAEILRAFGVTEDDLTALDRVDGYSAARTEAAREEAYMREVLIPRLQANVEAEINRLVRDYTRHAHLSVVEYPR